MAVIFKALTGTIPVGSTSITFTDSLINNESILDIYFSDDTITPTEQTQTGTSVTITIPPHTSTVGVALFINNCQSFSPYDDTSIVNRVAGCEQDIITFAQHIETLETNQGTLSSLVTTDKTNLVNAINENFTYVSSGKGLIATAITDKGIPTVATDTFQTMANNIGNISGGSSISNVKRIYNYSGSLAYNHNFLSDESGVCVGMAWRSAPSASITSISVLEDNVPITINYYTSDYGSNRTAIYKFNIISGKNYQISFNIPVSIVQILEIY